VSGRRNALLLALAIVVTTGVALATPVAVLAVSDGTRERLIPAVAEIVLEVDVAGGRVVIRPPDGLLEL